MCFGGSSEARAQRHCITGLTFPGFCASQQAKQVSSRFLAPQPPCLSCYTGLTTQAFLLYLTRSQLEAMHATESGHDLLALHPSLLLTGW